MCSFFILKGETSHTTFDEGFHRYILCIHFFLSFWFLTGVLFIFTFWPLEANQSNQIVDHVEKSSKMAVVDVVAVTVDGRVMKEDADGAVVEEYHCALVPVRRDDRPR